MNNTNFETLECDETRWKRSPESSCQLRVCVLHGRLDHESHSMQIHKDPKNIVSPMMIVIMMMMMMMMMIAQVIPWRNINYYLCTVVIFKTMNDRSTLIHIYEYSN